MNRQKEHFSSDKYPRFVREVHHRKLFPINVCCGIFRNSVHAPNLHGDTLNGDTFMPLILNSTVSELMYEFPLVDLPQCG